MWYINKYLKEFHWFAKQLHNCGIEMALNNWIVQVYSCKMKFVGRFNYRIVQAANISSWNCLANKKKTDDKKAIYSSYWNKTQRYVQRLQARRFLTVKLLSLQNTCSSNLETINSWPRRTDSSQCESGISIWHHLDSRAMCSWQPPAAVNCPPDVTVQVPNGLHVWNPGLPAVASSPTNELLTYSVIENICASHSCRITQKLCNRSLRNLHHCWMFSTNWSFVDLMILHLRFIGKTISERIMPR